MKANKDLPEMTGTSKGSSTASPELENTLPISRSYQLEMFERSMEGNVIVVVRKCDINLFCRVRTSA